MEHILLHMVSCHTDTIFVVSLNMCNILSSFRDYSVSGSYPSSYIKK
jgi:hypothetical protein